MVVEKADQITYILMRKIVTIKSHCYTINRSKHILARCKIEPQESQQVASQMDFITYTLKVNDITK